MNSRIEALREKLDEKGSDAFICYSYPNYRYLSGFTGSLAIVIITLSRAVIISDFRYRDQIAEEVGDLDFVEIKGPPEETVLDQIRGLDISTLAFESAHLTYRNYAQLDTIDSLSLVPTENWIEDLRVVKDPDEVERIQRAATITEAAVVAVASEIRPGMTEKQVADRINELIRSQGGKKEAFDLIVASGPRSAMPHAQPTDRGIEPGQPIVIDIGAQFEGYHSDLTRTIWLGRIEKSQVLEIYKIVENAQAAAIEAIRPGMLASKVDAIARDLIAEAGYKDFFGHGLGHGVGLDVHEAPTISRLGKGEIEPGMVFTVEPGIYIPGVGGVRIEDMVVVTEQGCRRLTGPAHLAEISE
jgi:Xaa-Pro aminopeptidase